MEIKRHLYEILCGQGRNKITCPYKQKLGSCAMCSVAVFNKTDRFGKVIDNKKEIKEDES